MTAVIAFTVLCWPAVEARKAELESVQAERQRLLVAAGKAAELGSRLEKVNCVVCLVLLTPCHVSV